MLNYNFLRIFKARGIDRPFTYLIQSGFSDSFATRIKQNKVKLIRLKELERLCLLLNCTPNDFMEWVPDENSNVSKEHRLNTIRKTNEEVDMVKTINSIPVGKIAEINRLIQEEIKK